MVLGQEKVSFLNLPTPLEYLKNISEELGIKLYLKRDDMTGLGMGGNKLRKLEYILKEAQDKGATMLVTEGGVQTNHGRLTAAVAAKYNMRCAIVTIGDYPGELSANLLLDRLMGAEVIIKKDDGRPSPDQYKELVMDTIKEYEAQGETVYYIPLGGSDDIGILGYYECAAELTKQATAMGIGDARVISAVGSIGTYMGLYCGLHNEGSSLKLTGVAILPFDDYKEQSIVELFDKVKEKYGMKISAGLKDFDIERDYVRGGYNLPSREVRDAVCLMARKEAILLDPCYTGKCFAAIPDMIKEGKIKKDEKIIMIHSGGAPGLYTKHHRVEFEKELIDGITVLD
ncbi:1-aminocyclopropane-1-carboxylate deaminase/D-cysteine desulfhydrase [Lacrimispora brassicae]